MTEATARSAPASHIQRVLRLMEHYRGANGALNNPLLYRLLGPLDVPAFARAVRALTARHEALRTTFTGRGPRLTQLIHPPGEVEVRVLDASGDADPDATIAATLRAEICTSFDVERPLAHWILLRRGGADWVLCINLHHLVTDGWSNGLLWTELKALYGEEAGGPPAGLPPVAWQYADFARWHTERLSGPTGRAHRDYWMRQLDGARAPQLPRPPAGRPAVGLASTEWFDLDAELTGRLHALATAERTTAFAVLLSLFVVLLARSSGQQDLTVSSLVANRMRPEVARTVGPFVNVTALRTRFDPDAPFTDVLRGTRATLIGALAHQEYPLQLLPTDVVATDAGRADDVVFQLVPHPLESTSFGNVRVEPATPVLDRGVRFDLEVDIGPGEVAPGEMGLRGGFRYSRDRFTDDWARGFVTAYLGAARAAADEPGRPASRLVPGSPA